MRGGVSTHLSQLLGFPESTVNHIPSTFLVHDHVALDAETKKYSLGFRFLSIGSRILDHLDIRKTAYVHLRKLHEKCNEAVHLSILRNRKVTYIDKIQKAGGAVSGYLHRLQHGSSRCSKGYRPHDG